MRSLYLTLLLLFYQSFAFAQKDFRKGYIIQGSDTISGYVDYRGDSRSAQITLFKPTLKGNEQRYTPSDIAGYGFENENKMFDSKLVLLSDSANAIPEMLFLNALIKGKVSIYLYRDTNAQDHYFLQKDSLLIELTTQESRRTDPETGRTYGFTYKKYIGVLNVAFADCETLSASQINNVKLNQSSLISITDKYNKCAGHQSVVSEYHKKKPGITIGPALLYSYAKLEFSGDDIFSNTIFTNENHMGAGIFMNVTAPALSEKLSLQAELLYVPGKFTGNYSNRKPGDIYVYDILFDLAYLKLPVQLRYTYPKGRVTPFINAGFLVIGYVVKDTQEAEITSPVLPSFYSKGPAIYEMGFKRNIQGLTAGTGLNASFGNHATLSIEGRYELNNGLSKLADLRSKIQVFSMILSLGF